MAVPRVCVLRAPGTNCDVETAFAFTKCGAVAEPVHLFRALERPELLRDYQILCIPGGFSYGDDIGAGVIFASQLRGHLAGVLGEFLQADKLMLGICNGFQVLLKAGILPGGASTWNTEDAGGERQAPATLTWNDNGKYTARWVHLRAPENGNVFLRGLRSLELPIAHGEGKLVVRDPATLRQWRAGGQIGLCYGPCGSSTEVPEVTGDEVFSFPTNPNGSVANIAGLGDPSGRVLGLMPHPERYIFGTQHPQWTRRPVRKDGEGLQLFQNAVAYFG